MNTRNRTLKLKALPSLFVVFVLAAAAIAQRPTTPVEIKAPDGRTVILKPDGTWEYKSLPPTPTTNPSENSNISKERDSLGPNFAGHDTNVLYSRLQVLKERFIKGEFENTAQYQSRIEQEMKKPIIDSLTLNDAFSLVLSDIKSNYDADTRKMRYFIPVRESPYVGLDKTISDDLKYSNLYSLALRSGSYGISDISICFNQLNGLPLSGDRYDAGFSADVSLTVEEARRLKNTTKAVVIVQFLEPFVAAGNILTGKQFQVRLNDVLFFDPETGRVLERLKKSTR